MQHRGARALLDHQLRKEWFDGDDPPIAAKVRVGIMGIGVLGADAARKLAVMGYDVAGWSPSGREVPASASIAARRSRMPSLRVPTFSSR